MIKRNWFIFISIYVYWRLYTNEVGYITHDLVGLVVLVIMIRFISTFWRVNRKIRKAFFKMCYKNSELIYKKALKYFKKGYKYHKPGFPIRKMDKRHPLRTVFYLMVCAILTSLWMVTRICCFILYLLAYETKKGKRIVIN